MKKRIVVLTTIFMISILGVAGCKNQDFEKTPTVEDTGKDTENDLSKEEDFTESKIIHPLPSNLDLQNLQDCTVAVKVEEGAILGDEGKILVTVYDQELYDMVDIANLKAGDTLVINGEQLEITEVETNELGTVLINGGLDLGGYDLVTEEDGVYYSLGYSDVKNYLEIGETELTLSSEFVYCDQSDPSGEEQSYTLSELSASDTEISYTGTPNDTKLLIQNGEVTSMTRSYRP